MTTRETPFNDRSFYRDTFFAVVSVAAFVWMVIYLGIKSHEVAIACKAMEAGYEQVNASGTVLWKKVKP